MTDKLVMKSVSMFQFRSWASGMFEFEPGVTLVTGVNGSGKTTIGMAVQFAINGKLSRLSKDDLKQFGSNAPMKVKIVCERNGEELTVERGQKLIIRQGKTAVSVRESTFMAELQRSVDYSFLSQTMASFVDMPEYKRKELLDSLIPEVTVLRSTAAPLLKTIIKNYYERRYNFGQHIHYAQDAIADMENSIKSARLAYDAQAKRHAEILAQQQAELCMTEEEYQKQTNQLAQINEQIAELQKYKIDVSRWLTTAQQMNRDADEYNRLHEFFESERLKLNAKLESLRNKQTDKISVSCPSCKVGLTCANCGSKIVDLSASTAITEMIKADESSLFDVENKLREMDIKKPGDAVPVDVLQEQQANLNRAENDLNALTITKSTLGKNVSLYEQQLQNIEVARKIVLDEQALKTMQNHINELEARREELLAQLKRKEHTYEIMQRTEEKLTKAADILYTVLPTMYFDQFLQRLTYACNYLLESISSMRISMSANADGIGVYVDNYKLSQLSSGELQRVRVAVTLSFSLLAVRTDTLFLDEMFDTALDEDGVIALATLLRGPIMKFYKKVVVITHNKNLMDALAPDRIVRVFKDENKVSKMETQTVSA